MRIRKRALTFEDVLLVPAKSEVLPKSVCTKIRVIGQKTNNGGQIIINPKLTTTIKNVIII